MGPERNGRRREGGGVEAVRACVRRWIRCKSEAYEVMRELVVVVVVPALMPVLVPVLLVLALQILRWLLLHGADPRQGNLFLTNLARQMLLGCGKIGSGCGSRGRLFTLESESSLPPL